MVKEIIVNEEFIAEMDKLRQPDKTVGLIEACSKNVIVFAERMLGITLYAWQVKFAWDLQQIIEGKTTETEALALTPRQVGKSTVIDIVAFWASVFNKRASTIHNNTNIVVVSRGDTQAKKLLREIRKIYRFGDKYMRDTYRDAEDKPLFGEEFFTNLLSEKDPNNTTTITFKSYEPNIHGDFLLKGSKSGSSIVCHPPTAVVLGETISICLIDEAGHEKISDTFFYDELYPTGDSTDALFIYTSTPWKPSGFFYEFCDEAGTGEYDHILRTKITIEALRNDPNPRAQKQYKNVLEKIQRLLADGRKDEVDRSYYCKFVKGELNYFDPKDVREMFDTRLQMATGFTGKCDLGVDFGGQTTSKTVLTVSTMLDDGTIMRLWHKAYPVGKDDLLIEDIESQVFPFFNIQRVIPDECPQGDFMIRKMKDKGWDVHPMNFRAEKVKKYGAFRSTLHRGEIKSYPDEQLQIEMYAMEFNTGSRQSVIQHADGYSDDLIDSFVMSTYFYIEDDDTLETYDYMKERTCDKCGSDNLHFTESKYALVVKCMSCGNTREETHDDEEDFEW